MSFYDERDLPAPVDERWPGDRDELRECIAEADGSDPPLALIGGGEHVRPELLEGTDYVAVRTEEVDEVLSVDGYSGRTRVEAGCRWGKLRERLRGEGLSARRFALQPSDATIGGLLARNQPLEPERGEGQIAQNCIALSSVGPTEAEYGYLPAPRKASGPDFRYVYIGGEGALGAILDATLVTPPRREARLIAAEAEGFEQAVGVHEQMRRLGLSPDWSYWRMASGRLECAFHGPEALVEAACEDLRAAVDTEVEIDGTEAALDRRRELEDDHPARRSLSAADRALDATWRRSELAEVLAMSDVELEDVLIWSWARRRVRGCVKAGADRGSLEPFTRAAVDRPSGDEGEGEAWYEGVKQKIDPGDVLVDVS
ncbi:MAG: FAD-binding protein [Bradymonadaceae bacterium]